MTAWYFFNRTLTTSAIIGSVMATVPDTATPVTIYSDVGLNTRATLYADSTLTTTKSNPLTPTAAGIVSCYLPASQIYWYQAGTATGTIHATTVDTSGQFEAQLIDDGGAVINAKKFNLQGNGTDETTKWQTMASQLPAGAILDLPYPSSFYGIDGAITFANPVHIRGLGFRPQIKQGQGGLAGFIVTSNSVTLENLRLTGPQYVTSDDASRALYIHGADSSHYISNLKLKDVEIDTWGAYGIYMQYVNDFDLDHIKTLNINYAAIAPLSCSRGTIRAPRIDTVPGLTNTNGYGVTISQLTSLSVADPRATDIIVSDGVVNGIPTWDAYAIHACQGITFVACRAYNCGTGWDIGIAVNVTAGVHYAPIDVSIIGGESDAQVNDGSARYGITYSGSTAAIGNPGGNQPYAQGGVIVGVTLRRHGNQAQNSGGLYAYYTNGLSVVALTTVQCSPYGELWYHDNQGSVSVGCSHVDPWCSNTSPVGESAGVRVESDYNSITIDNHRSSRDNSTATQKSATGNTILLRGVDISNQTHNDIELGSIRSDAASVLVDPGGKAITTLYAKVNASNNGIRTKYTAGTGAPTGGSSGDIIVRDGELWANSGGTWKKATLT